ncbi:MAG: DUF2157 domain-containing protein, partial [bacterium]|nr:DUF2157 domain-containing protein [bacterium]
MNKSAVIKAIKELASAGVISEDEIVTAYREASGVETGEVSRRQERYSGVLYFIGGGVIFIGIVALIAQVWRDLGAVMHIVVTLGSGLAAYVVGVLLSWSERVGAAGMG